MIPKDDSLSTIRDAMDSYKISRSLFTKYQLEFMMEESSQAIKRARRQRRLRRILQVYLPGLRLSDLIEEPSSEETKESLMTKMEGNLSFMTEARKGMDGSLDVLFGAWDMYGSGNHDAAISMAHQSRGLSESALKNCIIGVAKESIRRVEAKVSSGKKMFAHVKDARKSLDQAKSRFSEWEKEAPEGDVKSRETLEQVIEIAKSAEVDAQYSIDDARAPFVWTVFLGILALIGGGWTLFTVLRFLNLI